MRNHEIDKLLEESFSGDPPDPAFRTRVLADSTAALSHARRVRARCRWLRFGVAAACIVGASFLLGRHSLPPSVPSPPTGLVVAEPAEMVMVSSELVAWLDAARLFKQLGMEDRMARAVDRAGRLLPADAGMADGQTLRVFAAGSISNQTERVELRGTSDSQPSAESTNRILAQAFGD